MIQTRGLRVIALAALTLAGAGCEREPLDGSDVRPASLALELLPTGSAGGPAQAFDRADAVWLRVGDGARVRVEREIALPGPGGTDARVSLEVPLRRANESLDLTVELRFQGAALFRGASPLELRAGRAVRVPVTIDPVVHGLVLPDTLPALESYGDSIELGGAVVFATGDTIDAVELDWTSLEPEIIAIERAVPVAKADGLARLVGRAGEREDTVRVRVFAVVRTILLDPSDTQLPVGQSRRYRALLFDARGNPIHGRAVGWSSSNPAVVTIDSDGLATGVGVGDASISAVSGSASRALQLSAPAAPPVVAAPNFTEPSGSAVTAHAHVTPGGTATTVVFEWSTTPAFHASSKGASQQAGATGTVSVSSRIEGLAPGATYYIRAIATNAAGTTVGPASSFVVGASAPMPTTLGAIGIGRHDATLLGSVVPNGTTEAWFEWSTSADLSGAVRTPATTLQGGSAAIPVSAAIAGLSSATRIHFRLVARNAAGQVTATILSFTTAPPPGPADPPDATTGTATGVMENAATLNATVNANGAATQVWFDWGTDPALAGAASTTPQSIGAGAGGVAVAEALSGLAASTTYYFRVRASSANGDATGAIASFTTDPPPGPGDPPDATTEPATGVTYEAATLNATVNPNGAATQVWFEWGTDPGLAGAASTPPQGIGAGSGGVAVTDALAGLAAATTYYFRVRASSANGDATGAITSFTTHMLPPAPVATTQPATGIGRTKGTLHATVDPNGAPAQAWFEWGTDPSLATFSITPAQAVGSGTVELPVSEALTGLEWEIRYYYRIVASGPGGTVHGAILNFRAMGPPGSD